MSTSNPQALASPSSQYSSPPRLLYSGPVPNRDRRASPQPRRGYSPSWPVDSSSPPPLPEWRARRHVPGAFKHYDHHYQEPSRQIQSQMGSDGRPGWRNVISSNDDFPGAYRRLRSPSRGREHFKKDPPVVNLPPDDYLEFAKPTSENKDTLISDKIIPKLLVLDLNGALVYRRRSSGSTPLPRPYLCCFLEYLFLPEPDHADGPRPWEVFVWSSAQPHNVRAMVEACFGQKWIEGIWEDQTETSVDAMKGGEGRLIGVWARDKMGLSGQDYSRKVQTTKNLNLVIDHLNQTTHFNQPLSFSQKTTVLLDDSPLKAVFQPWSQIVIPEFDEQVNLTSRLAAGINPNSRATPDKETAEESQGEMDEVLLAVVGILDELRYVSNVPFWVRSGGLDLALNVDGVEEPTVETLPSHETFQHWYKDKELHAKWVEKGKEALKRKGIEVRHGLVGNAARSPGSPREPRSPRQPYPEPRPTQSDISLSSATSDMPFDKEESAFARRKRLAEERATKEAAGIPLTQKEKKEAKKALSKAHHLFLIGQSLAKSQRAMGDPIHLTGTILPDVSITHTTTLSGDRERFLLVSLLQPTTTQSHIAERGIGRPLTNIISHHPLPLTFLHKGKATTDTTRMDPLYPARGHRQKGTTLIDATGEIIDRLLQMIPCL
ncbi:hypothetical protein L198_01519 [Cryptococcus wingfieldii CBS 7118]|uniref:FCP1 homology domain-containing protein n=1 Tax=Cryptococcus wingfieldii CBS 7118 TaxID=1295528 RepID=A0A1E3K1G4_9TREE|nr:hypothetical protein L198_01519 [Cryptococcus wingfieldii CBS 7118]ODO06287.1 hypothetical protein L198_01519 [Cryptococcus wingfieldii CBS 7118]